MTSSIAPIFFIRIVTVDNAKQNGWDIKLGCDEALERRWNLNLPYPHYQLYTCNQNVPSHYKYNLTCSNGEAWKYYNVFSDKTVASNPLSDASCHRYIGFPSPAPVAIGKYTDTMEKIPLKCANPAITPEAHRIRDYSQPNLPGCFQPARVCFLEIIGADNNEDHIFKGDCVLKEQIDCLSTCRQGEVSTSRTQASLRTYSEL